MRMGLFMVCRPGSLSTSTHGRHGNCCEGKKFKPINSEALLTHQRVSSFMLYGQCTLHIIAEQQHMTAGVVQSDVSYCATRYLIWNGKTINIHKRARSDAMAELAHPADGPLRHRGSTYQCLTLKSPKSTGSVSLGSNQRILSSSQILGKRRALPKGLPHGFHRRCFPHCVLLRHNSCRPRLPVLRRLVSCERLI